MISFPALEHIDISGYGLYPGRSENESGLHAAVMEGLTLVIGANGLGKTTLITLLYRMLSGPADIPNLGSGEELGTRRLEATSLPTYSRNLFANRVANQAQGATATLQFHVGGIAISLTRHLTNLALAELLVNGKRPPDMTETVYQNTISLHAGVGSFGDFLLMLRYLVFYFEDRRALVWDQSAQRQLLRMLFLPPQQAQRWTEMEREILAEDSQVRNFQAVVGREERTLVRNLNRAASATTLRAELETLEALQDKSLERIRELGEHTAELDNLRQRGRTTHMEAQQERESRFRAVEQAKMVAIQARFPEQAATGRYILAHLMTEHECLVCGTRVPEVAEQYKRRIEEDHCVVCATPLSQAEGVIEAREIADERVRRQTEALAVADLSLAGAASVRIARETDFDEHRQSLARLESEIAERSSRIDAIVAALPPSDVAIRTQRDDLARIRGQLENRKVTLAQ